MTKTLKPYTFIKLTEENKEELIEKDKQEDYGMELILDIHEVSKDKIHAKAVKQFCADLCDEIGMSKGPNVIWGTDSDKDEYKDPKADGISCVQFLHSSSITLHAIDLLGKVFINIFSCKDFDAEKAENFALTDWGGEVVAKHNIIRK